jgi:hypothetical protein
MEASGGSSSMFGGYLIQILTGMNYSKRDFQVPEKRGENGFLQI